jgi:hypothetical protein
MLVAQATAAMEAAAAAAPMFVGQAAAAMVAAWV